MVYLIGEWRVNFILMGFGNIEKGGSFWFIIEIFVVVVDGKVCVCVG